MEQSLFAHLLLVRSATCFSAKDDNYRVNGYCSSDRSTHSFTYSLFWYTGNDDFHIHENP